MANLTTFFLISLLYAHISIFYCNEWLSSQRTFEEPDSQPLHHIAVTHFNDYIFVAGRNVLYRLSSPSLQSPLKIVTGPELDHPQCFLGQPCEFQKQMTDNDNRVLKVLYDHPFNDTKPMLLVCGSLYHGLCQLRDLQNLNEYQWIGPYNDSFGFGTNGPSLFTKSPFGGDIVEGRLIKKHMVWYSSMQDDPAVRTSYSPPFMSSRILVKENNSFLFQYTSASGKSVVRFEGNATRYALDSFEYSDHVYFVIVHFSEDGKIGTRLARVCMEDTSFQSYAELTISCNYNGTTYDRALAAYFGKYTAKMKSDHQLGEDEHTLYVCLARFMGHEVRDQAICGFHMTAVTEAFDSGQRSCFSSEDPIRGVDCNSTTKDALTICGRNASPPHLVNKPYVSKIVVVYFRPTLISFNITAFSVWENMRYPILIGSSSLGQVFKANLDRRKFYAFNDILTENERKAAFSYPLTMLRTSRNIYFGIKHKVVNYPLFSCSPHVGCARCVVNGRDDPLQCGWCIELGKCTFREECGGSATFRNDSCPPTIKEVTFEYPVKKKGIVITITGWNFSQYIAASQNNVTVSNADCEVETWNETQVICTLTTLPKPEPMATLRLSSSNLPISNASFKIFGSDKSQLNLTQYKFPKLYAMFPSKGPTCGGTHVIIYGENLDSGNDRVINVRQRRCTEVVINANAVWCITDKTVSLELTDTISFEVDNITFEFEEYIPDSFNMTGRYRNFTYLPDPQIYQIHPGITTVSGLMNVTVIGRHLDSVETPEMNVRVTLSHTENVLEFKTPCWSDPVWKGRKLTCRSPQLRHPGIPLPTHTFPLIAHVTFLMDGAEELRDLYRTKEVLSRLIYYPDPEITPFSGIKKIIDNETLLEIKGRYLDLIENPDNFHVIIGGQEICKIMALNSDSIQCELPSMFFSNSSILGTNILVEVIVGVSMKNVGFISISTKKAETSIWVLVAAVSASCILLAIFIWCCWRYKKTSNKSHTDIVLTDRNESGNVYTRQTTDSALIERIDRQVHGLANPSTGPLIAETKPLIAETKPLIAETKPLILETKPLIEEETLQLIKAEGLFIETPLLILGEEIGSGQFGCVYEGLLQRSKDSDRLKVAVKTIRNLNPMGASKKIADFMGEALNMKDLKHPNVLSLIGISFEEGLPLVVLPFMENGDLCKYLQDWSKVIMKAQLFQFAIDVADGMTYLANIRFVHRDLAARNCVLDSELNAKVSDFGLSRDIYEKDYYSSSDRKVKLPCKWMAPESLEGGLYTEETDVWSYGVLLWEVMTLGKTPYASVIGWDVLAYLKSGRRLPQPKNCPEDLYALMRECWAEDPNERPCFEKIRDRVSRIATELVDEATSLDPTTVVQNPGYL